MVPHIAGERIGPFELLRPLGRGGMGEVWLARQADGRVERNVALKLPMFHQQGVAGRERFRRERDILARLEHPNIARLYDAGVTESGQPWLAMEFVEGTSITEHAATRALSLPERLALFRQVLGAVAHAHRHLVVHRDLKPANILIDAGGQVKLLDFGIATLLHEADGTAGDVTRGDERPRTPRYAAPEQAAGEAVTTATDVHALAVILGELLAAGASPHAVPADLEAIAAKGMRAEPAGRYASAELFDEDILAHLEGRPVQARAGTWRYRGGRFALRHKVPLAMATVVLAALCLGLVLAERERRVAVAEKARAEKHFAGVRKLANAFIFDVHGEIENLAGALKARQKLVGTALEYLDRLAAESGGDPVLAVEVAGAYRKLAEIRGDSRGAHLGDPADARRNAERAVALLESVEATDPDNLAVLREHRVVALLLGRLTLEAGDASGVNHTARAAAIAERIVRLPSAGLEDRRNLAATLAEYGGILAVVKGDAAAAAVQLDRAIALLEALVREFPADVATQASLAYACERRAMAVEISGRPEDLPRAIALLDRSIAATEAIVRDDPLGVSVPQTLVRRYNNAARVRLKAGDIAGARDHAARGRALVERLAASDPGNVANATMRVSALATSSDVELREGRHERAIALAREAIAADARLPAEVRTGLIVRENVTGAKQSLAASACALSEQASLPRARRVALVQEARTLLSESRAFKQELVQRGIDASDAAIAIGEIDAELRRCDAVRARLDKPGPVG
ncbi:hypothetical protein BWI17_21930 [Betaproteobacteria bacterium GR16-43]|nr:hypothetical protein BWI17_21930 [Betaproteobacteria bacterium GR16-43]